MSDLFEPKARGNEPSSVAAPARVNRSAEELAMRDAIEVWGRARWPDSRVIHELVTGTSRIDMAFVRPTHLIGVEIKSSRDVLDRLKPQIEAFKSYLPELWIALAPKWQGHHSDAGYTSGIVSNLPRLVIAGIRRRRS